MKERLSKPYSLCVCVASWAVLTACGSDGPTGSDFPPPGGGGNTWTSLALMIEPRQEVGVAALGTRIFVAGGFRANGS
ncbi:MAG TPA: hypothetical protein VFO85_02665, partial [Vicinamibacteria bacterium]|nr:hypothetical protein [Vicinamibacteria bacterium]